MTNWLAYGLLLGLLTGCALRPERGSAGGADAVKPLWEETNSGSLTPDTTCRSNFVALLIGIGQYDPKTGWEPLQARNDVLRMTEVLRKQGVVPGNIHVLLDQQATRSGITTALRQLADTLRRGSRLLILYGGHARQIPDDNHDEADGYDEAIVPFDAPPVGQLTPDGYLRDDELNEYFTHIRATLGPTGLLWLLFDSCHSHTLHRGQKVRQRGGVPPLGSAQHRPKTSPASKTSEADWYETPADRTDLAPYVVFSAAADGASSFETTDAQGRPVGPLTRAVGDVWTNATPDVDSPNETYRTFFNRVVVAMAQFAPYQRPALEGDADRPLAGCLPRHATDSFFRARAEALRLAWPRTDTRLTHLLGTLPFVQRAADHPDLRIDRRGRGYRLSMAPNDQSLTPKPVTAEECIEHVRQYFARNVLLNLHQTNPDFRVQARLQRLSIRTERGQTVVTDTLPDQPRRGVSSFPISTAERLALTLTNVGPQPFYVTLIDLLPDGKLHVLLPEVDRVATDYQLRPGQSLRRRIRLTEPAGAEVYKVLLTPMPIDLQAVLQTRGNQQAAHPYEYLFQRIYAMRGAAETPPLSLSDRTGATADVVFWVKN